MTQLPFRSDDLEQALLPFGESTMLPAVAYTSPEIFEWERTRFFAGAWACVGREAELRADGATQRAVTVGRIPVLLTWDGDETLRAFANTCRHRGHELVADGEAARKQSVVCPYHAWTYGLDGALTTAPGFREVPSFQLSAHGLGALPVERWHGWVMVNADGRAGSLHEHVGDLEQVVAPYAPERLVRLAAHDYVVAANWKVATENYHECYHCPLIHPELCQVSPPTSGENYDLPGAWVGGCMDLREHAATMSLDGHSDGPLIDGADPRRVLYLGLFPNLLLSLHPDYVMTHRLTPLAADRTRIECAWYFPDADTDPAYAVDFWDRTNRQDWGACESVQRGLASPHFRPGPLAPNEDAVHQFVSMVARGYLAGEVAV